jgi:hypothetical protein
VSYAGPPGLVSVLTMIHSLAAGLDQRPADVAAPMDATGLDEGISENDSLGFGFGPTSPRARRMAVALKGGEPGHAVSIAESVRRNGSLSLPAGRATGWTTAGRWLGCGATRTTPFSHHPVPKRSRRTTCTRTR